MQMMEGFPTCALAVLDFDVDSWHSLAFHGGKLLDFIPPARLPT